MKIKLTMESLSVLDQGKVRAAVDKELRHVLADLSDRPGEKSARTVSIDIKLTPEQDESGVAVTGQLEVEVSSSVPKRRTRSYQFEIHEAAGGTQALFNDVSRTDVRQGTLDEVTLTADSARNVRNAIAVAEDAAKKAKKSE